MKYLIIIYYLLFSQSQVFTKEIDSNEIVKEADLRRGLGNISHTFSVVITNQDQKKEEYTVFFKNINSTLTEQTYPERARGRKILMKDYDIWLFTKNLKKPLRISLEQKLTGEVSNGDIARTNYAEDYNSTLLGIDKNGKNEIYRLDLRAKNKKVTYSRIEYVVNKKDYIPIEATFFALSGKPLKRAQFSELKLVQGMQRITKMVITDYLQKDKHSTLIFFNHQPKEFNDSLFNKDRMD